MKALGPIIIWIAFLLVLIPVGPGAGSAGDERRSTIAGRCAGGGIRKRANLRAALALYFVYYNFCKFHKSIRMKPAMAAGLTRKPWSLADLLAAAQGAAATEAAGAAIRG